MAFFTPQQDVIQLFPYKSSSQIFYALYLTKTQYIFDILNKMSNVDRASPPFTPFRD
jgi:hypothetical protein